MKLDGLKKIARICLYFAISAGLLTLIQVPFDLSFLAWVALVPFLLISVKRDVTRGGLVLAAFVVGIVYWVVNLYWMRPVTSWGWMGMGLYMGVLWPVLASSIRFCRDQKILYFRQKPVPLFLTTAVLFVGAERLQGFFLGGFFWRFLAHSQYSNLVLIQIADIFGAAGVSFLIGMVNGLIAELIVDFAAIRGGRERGFLSLTFGVLKRQHNYIKVGVVVAAVAGTIFYGYWRMGQTEEFTKEGPLVGGVQSNVPQSVKDSYQASEEIFEGLLRESENAVKAGAELVVWPETMVQGILSKEVLRYLKEDHPYSVFDKEIGKFANRNEVYVLAGATGGELTISDEGKVKLGKSYNGAFIYAPDGEQGEKRYYKIHLVPFGEKIPGRRGSWLHDLFIKFSPYEEDYTLASGDEYTVFEMAGGKGEKYEFAVMICYEDAVPYIGRKLVLGEEGKKRVGWLVNISNDGWFVRFKDDKVLPSSELEQHAAICVFRAVENRVAILRSVNTGISCLIDSKGQIRDGYVKGNLPEKAMDRVGVSGWFTDKVPIDSRVTFFSRYGQWLDTLCASGLVFCLILMLKEGIGRKKSKKRRAKR